MATPMYEVRWTFIEHKLPPERQVVRLIYKDGMECDARRVGSVFFPEGSTMYRYVDPLMWRVAE